MARESNQNQRASLNPSIQEYEANTDVIYRALAVQSFERPEPMQRDQQRSESHHRQTLHLEFLQNHEAFLASSVHCVLRRLVLVRPSPDRILQLKYRVHRNTQSRWREALCRTLHF